MSVQFSDEIEQKIEKEYQLFLKWVKVDLTKEEFITYLLLTNSQTRTRTRTVLGVYKMNDNEICYFDRKKQTKIVIQRIYDYLYCKQHNSIDCEDILFCFNRKEIIKSIHPKYHHFVAQAFRPQVTFPEINGQELNFDEILDPTKLPPLFQTTDIGSWDLDEILQKEKENP